MKLSVNKFNGLLKNLGQSMLWQRAYDCPCADPDSGAAKYDCPQCNHSGLIWSDPINTRAALAGQKVQRVWAQFGLYENGDVVLSIPSDAALYNMGEFDRVTFMDSSTPFSMKFIRGEERITFRVVSVDRVFWLDANDQIIEGGIPVVSQDGQLSWASGEPPANTQYSMTGRKHPEYFCWGDFPQDRAHHGGAALPRRVVLRFFELFRKGL
ncbi:MAG TPA: hypothetical protein ENJ08_12210 [Gammaproteobacteria bacterium]|nr:hypothetical protein [Gammaproteobacteria bacterium]